MADGLFDDLIPKQPAPAPSGGLFDDLVPDARLAPRPAVPNRFSGVTATVDTTAEPVVTLGDVTRVDPNEMIVPEGVAPGLGESLYRRAQAGLGSQVGGALRFLGESLAPDVGPVSPNVRAALDAVMPQRVIGQQVSTLGADVADFAGQLREAAQSGQRPEGFLDAITSPIDTLRYYGGIAAESLPATLGALATRNPNAATALIAGTTGGQVYGEQRGQGVSQPQALQQATQQALIEAAGSRGALEEAFTPGSLLARLPRVAAPEVLGESGTEVLQTIAERPDVPLGELLVTALDAAIASAPGAVVETLGGATERPPAPAIARAPVMGGPAPEVPSPAPAPVSTPERAAVADVAGSDPLADLDALLAALSPDTLAQAADVLGGPPSPAASPAEPPTASLPLGGEAAATPYAQKHHGPVPEITSLPASLFKARDMYETRGVEGNIAGSGLSREDWARTVDLSEPVEASIFSDGEIKLVDGHHRVAAAKILGKSVNVDLSAINAKPGVLNDLISRHGSTIESKAATAEPLEPVAEPEPIAAPERRRFASPDEAVREDFVRRAGELQVSPEAAEALAPAAPRDTVTGFFDGRQGNAKTEAIERAKQHQRDTDEPAVYVAADLFNLSGLNEAVGNRAETANTHYRAMAGLLNEELGRVGADVVPLRTGGDEIGFVVVNATPERVQTAVDAAQTRVQQYAQDNGLADIPHPKRSGERGVGLHIGAAKIDRDEPVSEILNRADDGIDSSKRGRNVTGRAEQAPGAGAPVARGTAEARAGAGEAVRPAGGGAGAVPPAPEVSRAAGPRPQQARLDEPVEATGPLAREEPQELTDADLTDAERAAFDRQRAGGDRAAPLRAAVEQALGPVAGKVKYLPNPTQLPDRLRQGVESRLRQRGGSGQTTALFDPKTGDVYLFTEANPSPERAVFNVAHEIAGHQGLRALLGDALNSALDIALQNPTVAAVSEAIALERNIDASTDAGQRLAAEEALAELAAAVRTGNYDVIADRYGVNVPTGIRDRVKAAIDNFLRRLKALLNKTFGQEFTDEDVRALLENAWQAAQGGPVLADESIILESVEPDERAAARASTRMTPAAAQAAAEVRRNDLSQTLPAGRGTIGWQYDDSAWIGTKGQASNARARLQDKMIAWRDVQQQIASQVSEAIPDTANVYRLENLMHGRVSTGIERIERVQVEPLVEAMRKAGVSTATLEEYLYARHAKERNADIAAKNPAMQDGGSGMTNAEADKILASADRAKLEPLARRVDALVRSTRQRLLDAGLITQQSFDAMEAQYSAYVPLRGKRAAETDFQPSEGGAGRGIDTRRNPVREALGRGAGNRAENLLGEVIGDAQRSVILAEKARVGRAVLRLVLTHPNPSLWQVEPVQTERTTDASGEVYERVVHDWSDPSIIAVKHRGQTYRVQINNVPLAQALSNVGVDQMGAVSRAAGAINRYFSAVLTKYNPAFLPVNATRDAIFGMTAMAAEHGELAALDAALHYPQAAAAAFRHSINKSGSGEWDTWAAEFADAGGRTGYVAMPSVEDLSRQIGKGALSGYSPEGVKRAAKAVADALGSMNDAVENALRLSAYVTLRKRGESAEAAASYAKDLTVNFNRKGYDGSRLNAWFLFYNAGLQGAKRVSDVLRKPKAWGYVGGLMAAQTIAAMYAMGLEDDDGEPLWNKVPDHVKRRNLVLVLPGGGVFTVPMPYGFNVFTYMAGRVPAAVTDRDEKRSHRAATVASDMLATATESFFPVPVGDGALGLLPTVLRIPVNIQTNRDDFGRAIRREESLSKFDVPRASMGRPDTLELFKLTAQGMNRVGGGDRYTPPALSWFDVAPEDMEYLLGELGGGAGKFAIDVATVGQNLAGGELSPPLKPQDIPITGRFVSSIDQQAATAALFYERRDAINRSLERVRDLYKEQGADAAEAALKAAPELTGAAFKRRKKDSDSGPAGSVIESNGRPQIIVSKDDSVFGRYKDAEEAVQARNEGVRQAYTSTPAALIPTRETRLRDASVRQQNVMRQAAQRELNAAWVRDVVGAAE